MLKQITSFESSIEFAKSQFEKINFEEIRKSGIYLDVFDYYLMGTYPSLKAMDSISTEEVLANAIGTYNLYIHIPFCQQLCTFCHFAKEVKAKQERIENYIKALCTEISMLAEKLKHQIDIKTIFFGGGTPSILQASQIKKIFEHLQQTFKYNQDEVEITFELHPGMIYEEGYEDRIQLLKSFGVNRWVSGVQTMDDKILKKLNRGHTSDDVYRFIDILRKNGINNLSIDLMYGLPYQTLENWYESIISLLNYGVDKFNIFPLMFKMSDPITFTYLKNPEIFPREADRFFMHFMAENIFLNNNFSNNPIFYYSKTKLHSLQQENKFEKIEEINLLPLGVSSFGYVGNTQFYNYPTIDEYMKSINDRKLPVWRGITLDIDERMRRTAMFSLRSNGINIDEYKSKFNTHPITAFPMQFELLSQLGLVKEENGFISLTQHGKLFSDGISLLFVSDAVKEKIKLTNAREKNHVRKSVLEKYDFSPISRVGQNDAKKSFFRRNIKVISR